MARSQSGSQATAVAPGRRHRWRSHPGPGTTVREVWAVCASLLDYPTPRLKSGLTDLGAAVDALPEAYADPLRRLVAHLEATPLLELQQEYVETFDLSRRCAPYLTYFSYGDTRRRGVALVQFKQAYRRAGVEFDPVDGGDELPDHLCAVLQLGADVDAAAAWKLLLDHRAGVEMLRLALAEAESPWHDAMLAVCATLPMLHGDEVEAVQRLIAQGPPAEEVGLQPYLIDPQIPVGPPPAAVPSVEPDPLVEPVETPGGNR